MLILLFFSLLVIEALLFSSLFQRLFKTTSVQSILFSLVHTPLLISLFYYITLYLYPSQKPWQYLVIFGLFFLISIIFLSVDTIKILSTCLSKIYLHQPLIEFSQRIILLLITIIFIFVQLRMWFWPINWDDQIYYIEQSYAIGQDKNLDKFLNWGYFKNDQLSYQINPSIRPALPLFNSLAGLISTNLQDTVFFSRLSTFYFFSCLTLILVYLVRSQWPIAIFFTYSSYLFINLSIFGFKELIIICQILLILNLLATKRTLSFANTTLMGNCFGLMAYVNYSGTVISIIIYLIYFIFQKNRFAQKLLITPYLIFLIIIFSGLEIIYFLGISLDSQFRKINFEQQFKTVKQLVINLPSNLSTPTLDTRQTPPPNTPSQDELIGYDIHNIKDKYIKGKLQGFFQIQYFGLIFCFFVFTLATNFSQIFYNRIAFNLLTFVILYYLIFIDIFNLNHHQYANILSISHKYSALLVPILSVIIATTWYRLEKIFLKISLFHFQIIFTVFCIFQILFPDLLTNKLMDVIGYIIPLHLPASYYQSIIESTLKLFLWVAISIMLITLVFSKYTKKLFNSYHLGTIIILITLFFMPFFIFFNTNFGLIETIKYSLSSTPTKLSKVKGWENIYSTVNFLNNLPQNSRFLFVNTNLSQLGIHLAHSATNNFTLNSTEKYPVTTTDINHLIDINQINYLIISPSSHSFPDFDLVHENTTLRIYRVPSSP